MITRFASVLLSLAAIAGSAAVASAQGNPTGTISGHVSDPDGLAVPGAAVTVASPVLQGLRTATTSSNGDYIIPFLPAGDYEVTFELQGFRTVKRTIGVKMAETQPLNITFALAAVAESVTVAGQSPDVVLSSTVASNFRKARPELLPVGRALNEAVLLAPGVAGNGPSGNIMMAGALSFESQYLIDAVAVTESPHGLPLTLFIEDAVQETKVSTGASSAEYGRFGGGVVNMITKSGGNSFSGSLRTTFNNDAWRSLTPFPTDQTVNKIAPVYEGTLGGPIKRDRIWFFGAGRFTKPETSQTLSVTGINYATSTDERRYEGKVTYALNTGNNARFGYTKRTTSVANNRFGTIMDLASLYDNSTDQHLYTANYTSVVSNTFFLEGQYSRKISATMDTGSRFTDLVKGTPISDRQRLVGTANPVFNSPTFCAVCGGGWLEHRDNWDWFGKASYFLSTQKLGSHNFVAGFDNFKEWRTSAGFARYVSGISTALVDAGSAGGRQASFSWLYLGPNVNTGSGPYLTADKALPILWDWFFANGGNNRTTRTTPNIPGLSTRVSSDVTSPSVNEVSLGVQNQVRRGAWRLDYVHRKSADMYGDFLNLSTGRVTDSAGRPFDLTLVSNSPQAKRRYDGLTADARYRFTSLQVGGNYTLSRTWGNFNGENVGSGPIRATFDTFPEYRQESWNYPMGYNPGDQRHKARAWLAYTLPAPETLGHVEIGVLQRADSGIAVDVNGSVDTRPYVTNPGYVTPVSSVAYYVIPRGDFRWDSLWSTDLAFTWGKKLSQRQKTEVFFRGVVSNVFNNAARLRGDIGINTRFNNTAFQAFNPFTTTPVKGVNWDYSPTFGQPQAFDDYQPPRQFSFSAGLRF